MTAELILLVDDEPSIVQLARLYLERDGYRIHAVGDGRSALQAVQTFQPALVVLDVMLPEMDGLEVCRRLRADKNRVPILMLTARDDDIDKILGLELGADDYLTKPFNPRELVARIKAILRRVEPSETAAVEPIRLGDLIIDTGRREVTCNGQAVDLRTQEFEVLLALAQHKGLVLSREQLLSLAWGYDFFGQTRTVDVHIAQLRRKLAASCARIETVTGIGYKLVV
ncbi:MAG: response regulator transcription factor [Anaerolineaceae bacterium]|nr:response regulator transcription factor [Anaerolineaceae bacterium]